ncbi:MAG: hypothetical protein FJ288_12105 [Planctomycetes bacterium]|nr:hypothetical protein [Planctomycetota bacterium]
MAILAGIDEAGYGPHLGPLVAAAAALEFAGPDVPEPDLWRPLADFISKHPPGRGGQMVICDSKKAYTAGGSLVTLERAVLGFLAAAGLRPRTLAELFQATSATALPAAAGDGGACPAAPWENPEALRLPLQAAQADIDDDAGRLAAGLARLGGRPAALRLAAASASRLNRLMTGERNKAAALFALAADLLAEVLRLGAGGPVHVTLDRHGGRRYYARLLAGAFPMTAVETLGERADESRYRLRRAADGPRGNAEVRITVRTRCESSSTAAALASMAAKYVRELVMRQMNAYFQARVPGLRPTAGYGLDAWRFLDDIAAARAALGVPDAAILRSR